MKKKRPNGGKPQPSPISYRPAPDVAEAIAHLRSQQEFPVDKTVIIDHAVRKFLREKGYDVAESDRAE